MVSRVVYGNPTEIKSLVFWLIILTMTIFADFSSLNLVSLLLESYHGHLYVNYHVSLTYTSYIHTRM